MESSTQPPEAPGLALNDIQGNVAGFNKDHQRFVFLRFKDRDTARRFVKVCVREIDDCKDVADFKKKWKRAKAKQDNNDKPPPLPTARWFNLALSFRGLQVLEAPEADTFPTEFKEGMRARASTLGDVDQNAPEHWAAPFSEEIHVIAILAADLPDDLHRLHRQLRRHITANSVQELGHDDGAARPGDKRGQEHFGYKDGASQPGVQGLTDPKIGQEMIPAGEFILGYPRNDAAQPAPPSDYQPVPPQPAPSAPTWAKDGSYLVFRRLRQDVKGFNDFVRQTSSTTGLRPDLLEAKLVGRYKSGAPLERTRDQAADFDPQAADPSIADPSILGEDKINNFEYEPHDSDGGLVPRAGHIRKMYPRNANPPGKPEAERRRILRRGISYGPEFIESESPYPPSGGPPADQDRGLLFLCYQASIAEQFEHIQGQWANKEEFPQPGDGRDPITSQDTPEPTFRIPPSTDHLVLQRWVITTGGEYFFAPSKSALRSISQAPVQ